MIGSRTFIVTMSKNVFVGIRDSNPVRNAFLHQPNAFGLCPIP
nr:MAG TPA: Neuropeptide FF [Caudoviricetes sp.]